MITPKFDINQDEEYIYIKIKISNIRFSAAGLELVVQENLVIFHLSPYYLRLRFPHNLVDDERAKAEYKASDESIDVQLPKEIKGQYFEDLDLPTKLLAREGDILGADAIEQSTKNDDSKKKGPLIQEIRNSDSSNNISTSENIASLGETYNWEIEQNYNNEEVSDTNILKTKYGFNDSYDSIISVSVARGNDINELESPEHTNPNDRVKDRLKKEDIKFDSDYYLYEYMLEKYGSEEDIEINGLKKLLNFTPPLAKQYLKWYSKANKTNNDSESDMPINFTDEEKSQMQNNLPKKSYLVNDTKMLYVMLINLLFSYMFEQLENEGTHTVESPWTIGKLTPQFAFLDQKLILDDSLSSNLSIIKVAIVTSIRRSLSYTLHRNFNLSMKALNFVYYILRGGKRLIIRCLLDIHEIFRIHDVYYVYNKIFLDDLCSWFISDGNSNVIKSLALEFHKEISQMKKEDIDFNLISGFDEDTGEPTWENMTLKEMELMAEAQYIADNENQET
ncbi:hypothetical protein TBLA_0G02410 [Henningerozyma blattae CBS 6284]|uniref:CS domain-containing protein n=1 Tax=Henningerozyma blattae (strain ATCC 34711 / CBS 6284 / DSM 70876 / NBRC 10599 / NRRL Y-10934 / UCD 77-7) TaxID=1071380 RepID=I2H729_HENB6|nr:hypothetical protein TBLA_0G02410 [Tetrapisispora blattae CBS 6284]CCH62181.1 hypothetical protein TBLA_0G02410 [Tetrapisispora blattae CBS 6284]